MLNNNKREKKNTFKVRLKKLIKIFHKIKVQNIFAFSFFQLLLFTSILLFFHFGFAFGEPNGSEDKPWEVSTYEDLKKVGTGEDGWNLDGHYLQTDDIYAPTGEDQHNFVPIGDGSEFTGVYDGDIYRIYDLYIDRPGSDSQGLFTHCGTGGIIRNVGLVNVDITGNNNTGGLIGGTMGGEDGIVENCFVTGSVTGDQYVGGLIGLSRPYVYDSYTDVDVWGGSYSSLQTSEIGGFIGSMNRGEVYRSYSMGEVLQTEGENVGAFVGSCGGDDTFNNYFDRETSGYDDSDINDDGAEPKYTSEMQDINTFLPEWDIVEEDNHEDETWVIEDGEDYPRLGWEITALAKVETDYATSVMETSASLHGEVTDIGEEPVEAYFQYRERDTAEWTDSGSTSISEPKVYDETISLDPETLYEYRAVVALDGDVLDEGEIFLLSTRSEKSWETEEDWQAAIARNNINIINNSIELSETFETSVTTYSETKTIVGSPNDWETYYEETEVNVTGMDEMYLSYEYELEGDQHAQGNAVSAVRVRVDGEIKHSDSTTGSKSNTWDENNIIDVSGKDSVHIEFQYYSESDWNDSETTIYWAAYEWASSPLGYESSGFLETDLKSMITSQPDLDGLGYELNDGTITVTVTGSPGQVGEETPDPVSLDGGTSYSLDWSEDHTYFALEIEMETDDEELTPVVSTITLSSDVEDHPEPQNVSLTDVFISSATLSWDKEEEADGYVLKASTDTDFSVYHSSSTQDIEVTTLTVSGLSVNTTYHFRVGNLFDGTTEWMSEPDHLSTSTLAEAPSLVEPAFTDVTCSTITVHWDGGDNPEWTPYVLEKSTEEFNGEVMKSTETYSDFFTFTGLEEKTTYYFRVKAVNNDGVETDYLHIGSTETLSADVPPAAVEEIWTSTETLTGGVRLWWESPGENEWEGTLGTESDPAEFRIQHSTRSDIEWGDHETFDLSISTWGVDPYETVSSTVSLSMETTYYFRLWTGNSHGEWSDISKGATEWARIAPAAVEDLQAQAEDDGSVDLSWTTPGNDGDDNDIDGGKYKIRMSTEAEVDWESDWDDSEGTWGDYSIEISTDITPDETHGMKVEGLRGGVSYYFHIWTRDSDEGANYPGNWSYISNRATETVTEVVSISISKGTYDFEEVVLDTSVVSSQSIDIENMGNVSLDYGLRISTITLPDNSYSLWKATDTASGHDLFMMYGLFNSADVSYDEFSVEDCITEELTSSTEEIFAGDQTGYGVEMGGVRRLWLRLDMPITLSRAREQRIKLRIEGTKE